jgi:hypothetical protein
MLTSFGQRKEIPFYSNTPSNLQCFQASFRMVLKYFLPDREFSWEELDALSARLPGRATWPQQMLLNLHKMNFDVEMIEGFDGPAFIEEGEAYLKRTFGKEAAAWQVAHGNIPAEQKIYKELLATDVHVEKRLPNLDEMQYFLDRGYLIVCTVNSRRLNQTPGYVGHAVVIYDINDTSVTLHDPGLPARKARQLTRQAFTEAWADPNDDARNFIAVKLNE